MEAEDEVEGQLAQLRNVTKNTVTVHAINTSSPDPCHAPFRRCRKLGT